MQRKLGILLDLQKVDNRLVELESTRGDLPQKVDSTKSELEDLKDTLEARKRELKEAERGTLRLEMDRNESTSKLQQYQEQLYRVTTNREYDAITMEIDTAKERIDDLEMEELELDDRAETLRTEISEHDDRIITLSTNLKAFEKELHEKLGLTNREEENLRSQRMGLVSGIDRSIYGTYERVRKAKSGIAVVAIQRHACGGCYSAIPPQRVLELRQMNKFITCEVCGRILIWQENEAGS
ncbi:MAG: C4-type zinc ribbon domain-containing protein [bacterium]